MLGDAKFPPLTVLMGCHVFFWRVGKGRSCKTWHTIVRPDLFIRASKERTSVTISVVGFRVQV